MLQFENQNFEEIVAKVIVIEVLKINSRRLLQTSTPITKINKVHNLRIPQHRRTNNQHVRNRSRSRINYTKLGVNFIVSRLWQDKHVPKECRLNLSKRSCFECQKTYQNINTEKKCNK